LPGPPAPEPRRSWSFHEDRGGVLEQDLTEPPPTLLQRLRAGRLDPGRRGVAALALVAVFGAGLTGWFVLRGRPQTVEASTVLAPGAPVRAAARQTASPEAVLVVAVSGDVHRPGIVRLPAGSRVDDAIRAAGGAVRPTDLALVNLARKVADGEQVVVGAVAVSGAASGAGAGAAAADGTVDLNAATAAQLEALPGIGPTLAQKIVDYRTGNGRFASVDQLREVSGIGESRYADLKPLVRV
jgi:competence protein ComEA